jgi:hypothetical protein
MCIKCAKTHLRASVISKNFPGLYPGLPLKRGGTPGREKGEGIGEKRKGRVKGEGGSAHPEMSDLPP